MFSANSYDALLMLVRSARAAEDRKTSLRDELVAVRGFPGAGGLTTCVNPGTVIKPISLMAVRNGKFVNFQRE